jgi:putative endonuclease
MTNFSNKVLYVGVTNSLKRRIIEHADGCGSVFTSKYNCHKLVYYESFSDIEQAIAREKQIKHFKREWKNHLIEAVNPDWLDLTQEVVIDPSIV